MVSELLPRLEDDEDGARTVVLMQHNRVARPAGSIDVEEVPALHARRVSVAPRTGSRTPRSRLASLMPLVVDSLTLGAFQSNCYLLRTERGAPEAVVVDPGDDPTPIRLELARMGARATAILVTHTDVDHIAGVADLADGTGAEVWAPSAEADVLRTGQTRGSFRVARRTSPRISSPAATP